MLDIDTLINFYRERTWNQPPPSELPEKEIAKATVAYLNGYKQLRTMLANLAKVELAEMIDSVSGSEKTPP